MVCDVEIELLNLRGNAVCEMLVPLAGKIRLAYDFFPRRTELLIVVRSGMRPSLALSEWRFTTIVQGVRASYHERWMPVDERRKRFYLERAYLHLYRYRSYDEDESEFLALHCDPNEPDDMGLLKHAIYKRGPHIHVTAAQQPLPHSHIALNLTQLEQILSSFDEFVGAVSAGVVMIKDQVLDVLDAHGWS